MTLLLHPGVLSGLPPLATSEKNTMPSLAGVEVQVHADDATGGFVAIGTPAATTAGVGVIL